MVFLDEIIGFREFTLCTLFCPKSPRDGAKKRPKTSKNDPKGPQRAPQGLHFGQFWLLWGTFWSTFGPSGLILGPILRLYGVPNGPNGPQSAPKRPMWVHLGPFWPLLKPIWVHFCPFWSLFHVLGGHFFITCPHILEDPFCTTCPTFHRFTLRRLPRFEVPACRYRFREALLRLRRSSAFRHFLLASCERSEQRHPVAKMDEIPG